MARAVAVARLLVAIAAVSPAAPIVTPARSAEQPAAVAVFKDDIPASGAPSSPDQLAGILREAGFETAFLNSEQLADRRQLTRDRFDVLLLPYGPSFPVQAADNFRRFLHAGGKFLSTGGYAFDNLLARTSHGWRPYQPPAPPALDGVAWFDDIPAGELRGHGRLTFRGWLKTEDVSGPGFAHFSVYQVAADGSLPAWRDICQARGTGGWSEHDFTFEVDPQAVAISLRAGLFRCRGQAWFDDVQLRDAEGRLLLDTSFEQPWDPDHREPRNWWRSHKERCTVRSGTAHSGSHALHAALDFEIPRPERLNTRYGRPEDGLEVEPTQLGVFQADYPLEHAWAAVAAPVQAIVDPSFRLDGPVAGWAACGVAGSNAARWMPLLNALDRYGRLRGAAGAMLRHYAGPWAGSSWAFFGVTNRDLFAKGARPDGAHGQPEAAKALVSIVRSLAQDTYVASLTTDQACYRQGEAVKFLAPIFNGGRQTRALRLEIEVHAGELRPTRGSWRTAGGALTNLFATVTVAPGRTNLVGLEWSPARFGADFYDVIGRLWASSNLLDCIESGFLVRDSKVIAAGPKLSYRDNYLRFDDRPLFLFGTDDWGYVFNTARETPLQWRRDMRQRRDLGVLLYENLQVGPPASPAEREALLRKIDGVVQLAQEFGQVYFAGLLIGYNAAASDSDLAAQGSYCGAFARRYADVPGLIYYLNGDYRCELSDAVTPQWNQFLRERYGSDAALRRAWGPFAPAQSLGQIKAEDYHDWEQTWADVSAYDRNCFRAWLLRRWNGSLISAIRANDASHPTSGEFYQVPNGGVDLLAGIDGLDLANFGFFEKPDVDLAKFPLLCKYNDQRAKGKSGGPGEYGVKTHPAWGDGHDYGYHTARTREQAIELFLAIPHYALGLGASRIHNWCWKDDADRVFPWGMVYPCDGVPKDTACVHRNLSLLFRHFAPVYEEPQIYVLTPDSHRLGGAKWRVTDGILTSIDLALAAHVDNLGVLNEQGLTIPSKAKVIFYPLPFCPPDETYSALLQWVRSGGVLYLSGDISYDPLRQRSRTRRLEELCGARFVSECYANIMVRSADSTDQPCIRVEPAGATVLAQAADGRPVLLENRVGEGRVLFTTDPIELHCTPAARDHDLALYRRVLATAGLHPLRIKPDDPRLHVFRVPLRDKGNVYVLFNTDESPAARTVTLAEPRTPVTLTLARHRPGLVWIDPAGAVRAVETQGACSIDGDPLLTDGTAGAVLTLDGQDVRRSRALLLMPLQPGQVRWPTTSDWRQPLVETGDFDDGRWRALEQDQVAPSRGLWQVEVSADQALSLLLVGEKPELAHWHNALGRAICDPASLP
jgi:hypothetical protein